MSFVPHLFIGIGETHALYTLRQTYLHYVYVRGPGPMGGAVLNGVYQGSCYTEVRSEHIKNLSTNAVEAMEKAKQYADLHGIELKSTLEDIEREMRQIRRSTAEELEARAKKIRERELAYLGDLLESRELKLNSLYAGYLPFGGMDIRGLHITKAPVSYINWLVENQEKFEEFSLTWIAAEIIKEQYSHLILPKPSQDAFAGTEGERKVFDVVCIKKTHFYRQNYYGGTEICYVTTMIDKKTNACMVVFSNSFHSLSAGQSAKIKATVKKHEVYKEQAQTVIQRVAIV